MAKRLLCVLLALCMVFSMLPLEALAADQNGEAQIKDIPFTDVNRTGWSYAPIRYTYVNGIFSGITDTAFWPNTYMNRGMFVTVLGRLAGVDPKQYSGATEFSDVPEKAYFAPYVKWAVQYGVTSGMGNGLFDPYRSIDRQQMASLVARYLEAFPLVKCVTDEKTHTTTVPNDMDEASKWAEEAITKLWQNGLMSGYDGANFGPRDPATRAQVAALCWKLDKAVETWYSEPGTPSDRERIDTDAGTGDDDQKPDEDEDNPGGSGGGGGGGGGIVTPPVSSNWTVRFYDGPRLIKSFDVKKGEPLGQIPTVAESSKAGYILEGYYTDSAFSTPFYAEDPVTGNLNVYAKYESMGDTETLTVDSFARMDQDKNVSFRFKALDGTEDTLEAAKAAVSLAVKDGSDPVEITVVKGSNGVYTVSAPDGFNEGCSYELDLAEGWTFLPEGSGAVQNDAIRTAAFSIEMEEVENLSMNEGIRYVKDTDQIDYTYKDKNNQSHEVEELPSDADFSGGGSFQYADASGWKNGDILCIYVGAQPNDGDDSTKTEEAVYAKVSGVSGGTVSFTPLAEEERSQLYDIPDNFPIQVGSLPAGNTGTVSLNDLDAGLYAQMMGASEGTAAKAAEKLSVGDFVTLYVSAEDIESEDDMYFGRITAVNGSTITYEQCTAQDIEDSADVYSKVKMTGEDLVTPEEKAEIEKTVQKQVEQSGFGEDAAYMLLDMASQTDGFKNTAALRNVLIQDEAGNELPAESVRRLARSARNVGTQFELGDDVTLKVELINSGDQLHFKNEGLQLAIGVEAEFEADTEDDGTVHINLSASFVQEVAVDPSIKGKLVYKKILKFIPIPTGVQINAIVDVKSFTAMSIKAEIFTEGPEDQNLWEKFQEFAKDPTSLGDIPGLPPEIAEGISSVGDALKKIDEMKEEISKKIEDLPGYENYISDIWEQIEAVTNGNVNQEEWEEIGENLEKTDITAELMNLMNLTSDTDLSTEYVDGLSDLMDRYSELLEKETDWVTLVEKEMFNQHTPEKFGVMIGVQGKFMVRTDLNLAIGSNLQYEVGRRYNFWFRVGLFKPTSGSSTMDLIDESFAFQFYVMGKLGIKVGVRLKIYAAIGSVDAISVGLTTELGPYLKLWGFFIYDYSKHRGANTPNWTTKEQMAGALYLEFGLYLMVGVEAKALFLDYDHDFVDKEFPLLDAGEKDYYYGMAYEPLDDEDEIVVYNDGSASLRDGCAVSMALPEEAYAVKVIDLTTGSQGIEPLDFDKYIFKVSNPNFRVDNVGGKPVVSVISIPENVRLMQCDLTITYKHGKLAFSTFDMSTTVHLAWTNMTASEYQQVYTASVTVPDDNGGREVIWSKRVRKGAPFDLPAEEEIKALLSWSDAKYTQGAGYNGRQPEGVTLIENTQYHYDLGYQTYQVTVTGIEGGTASQTFYGKYGEPFDFSSLLNTGENGPTEYTRFAGLMMGSEPLALNQPINGRFAVSNNAAATAQYEDETVTATFQFTGIDHGDMEMKLRRGGIPNTTAVEREVPSYMALTGFYPAVGPIEGDMLYQVVCKAGNGTADIIFQPNGGGEIPAVSKPVGSVLGTLPAPTRTGYTFGGWFTDDGTFQNQVDANTVVEGDMTLYAKWTAKSLTVTFNTNGGVNLTPSTKTVTYGQSYGELPTPERSGYGFQGWFTEQAGGTEVTASTTVSAAGDHTLYAHWVELKVIPRTVFDFGAQETFTYDKSSRTAAYTFNPDSVDCPAADSFTIDYIRVADALVKENTSKGAQTATAGTYNVHITREADNTYAKFDQNYTNVLVINRATRTLPALTNDDILLGEQGLTYQKVSLSDAYMAQLDQPDGLPYLAYRVQRTNYVPNSWNCANTVYVYDNPAVESGLLYDLTMSINPGFQTTYTIQNVLITGDVNYEDVESNAVSKQFTIYQKPSNGYTHWKQAMTDAGTAATAWYDNNETADVFAISTAEELAYFSELVWNRSVDFSGKTVRLDADIELYGKEWIGIGCAIPKTETNSSASHPFRGTFDGNGHTIRGMYGERGLFRAVDGAVIKNLTLEDSYVYAGNHYILVSSSFSGGNAYPGGIVGYVLSGGVTFENCVSTATTREKGAEEPKENRSEVKDRFYNTHESASGATVTGVPAVLRPYPRVESGGIE